jgi:hypothetical protein
MILQGIILGVIDLNGYVPETQLVTMHTVVIHVLQDK